MVQGRRKVSSEPGISPSLSLISSIGFPQRACPSCGKTDENMANVDYNEDYYDDSYYSSVYSDYPDSELETTTEMPKDYVLNETDLSSDFTYYDYASNKRKKRETEECKCQVSAKKEQI